MMRLAINTAHGRGRREISLGNRRLALWGQSNAEGRALLSSLSSSPLNADPGLATYASAPFERVYIATTDGTSYEQLEMGVNHKTGATQFGAEFGMAVRWMRETSSGNLYIEKATVSGAPISTFDPVTNFGYDAYINRRAAGNSWLSGQGITISDNHWLWVQGESDSANSEAYYTEALNEIINERLIDGQESASSIIVLAQMLEGNGGWGPGPFAAKAAIAAASSGRIKTVQFINSFLTPTDVHLDAKGMLQLGYDTFERLFSAPHLTA